ncbi:MAG TPA: hypothetical protein VFW64_16655 [Pseudonocardiaceae bacterium]|nr:hypothetical protein [Pseudonocardiaceae bacterium]
MALPDTAQRSLEHWSEARRPEMQAFYTLATEDYRQLAAARRLMSSWPGIAAMTSGGTGTCRWLTDRHRAVR